MNEVDELCPEGGGDEGEGGGVSDEWRKGREGGGGQIVSQQMLGREVSTIDRQKAA